MRDFPFFQVGCAVVAAAVIAGCSVLMKSCQKDDANAEQPGREVGWCGTGTEGSKKVLATTP
jgi:hypothetical protein